MHMERQETGGKVFSDLKIDRPTCVLAPSMRALARLRRSGPVSFSACVFFLRRPGSLRRGLLPALLFLPLLAGLVPPVQLRRPSRARTACGSRAARR